MGLEKERGAVLARSGGPVVMQDEELRYQLRETQRMVAFCFIFTWVIILFGFIGVCEFIIRTLL